MRQILRIAVDVAVCIVSFCLVRTLMKMKKDDEA